jgi:hypothetical protein
MAIFSDYLISNPSPRLYLFIPLTTFTPLLFFPLNPSCDLFYIGFTTKVSLSGFAPADAVIFSYLIDLSFITYSLFYIRFTTKVNLSGFAPAGVVIFFSYLVYTYPLLNIGFTTKVSLSGFAPAGVVIFIFYIRIFYFILDLLQRSA